MCLLSQLLGLEAGGSMKLPQNELETLETGKTV